MRKQSVTAHGVQGSRRAQRISVDRAQHRDDSQDTNRCIAIAPKDQSGGFSYRELFAGEVRKRHHVNQSEVNQHVDRYYRKNAAKHRSSNVTLRILYFATEITDSVP